MAHPSAVERRLSRDRILTEATIYWVTQSIATSFRPYYEAPDVATPIPPVEVPQELADRVRSFAREIGALPEHRKPSDEVGPAGIEPTTSTVESPRFDEDEEHVAPVTQMFPKTA